MTRVISARDRHKWGTFGSLYLLNRHGNPSFFTVFSKHILVGYMQENLKKKKEKFDNVFFLRRITFNGKILRKPSAIYAKYSKKNKKKDLSTKISKESLLEQKSKVEPTALTDYKKSLLFYEVCPASRKKNIQSFSRQFSFLRISFFLFFLIFFSTGATDFTEKKKVLVVHYTKYHT